MVNAAQADLQHLQEWQLEESLEHCHRWLWAPWKQDQDAIPSACSSISVLQLRLGTSIEAAVSVTSINYAPPQECT